MSKLASEHIFTLIKSLTRHEKRYFKVFATRHIVEESDNFYIQLYDIIDSQDVYDEQNIPRACEGLRFPLHDHTAEPIQELHARARVTINIDFFD